MKLRPFSRDDWDCYAGCDSKFPFIADQVVMFDSKNKWVGVAVIDSKLVQFHLFMETSDREDYDELIVQKEFETTEEAITYIMLCEDELMCENISADGFKPI